MGKARKGRRSSRSRHSTEGIPLGTGLGYPRVQMDGNEDCISADYWEDEGWLEWFGGLDYSSTLSGVNAESD